MGGGEKTILNDKISNVTLVRIEKVAALGCLVSITSYQNH